MRITASQRVRGQQGEFLPSSPLISPLTIGHHNTSVWSRRRLYLLTFDIVNISVSIASLLLILSGADSNQTAVKRAPSTKHWPAFSTTTSSRSFCLDSSKARTSRHLRTLNIRFKHWKQIENPTDTTTRDSCLCLPRAAAARSFPRSVLPGWLDLRNASHQCQHTGVGNV